MGGRELAGEGASPGASALAVPMDMQLTFEDDDDGADDILSAAGGGGGGGGASVLTTDLRAGDRLRGPSGAYTVGSDVPIGTGTSGKVYAGTTDGSGVAVAIKVIDRMEIDGRPDKIKQLTRELNITRKLKHPNIINLLDVVFDEMRAMLIMEMADGGMLFDLVSAGTPLPEERARYLFKQMVSAMSYCHSKDIYHRDLKLENVVLAPGEDVLKITDFGASKDASIHSMPKTQVGTISYMAPEVTNVNKKESERSYGAGADIWALGVILYVLVCCKYPFGFDGPRRNGGIQAHLVYENIRRGADAVDFPESLSPQLVELLRGIFTVSIGGGGGAVRWTLPQIEACEWLRGGEDYVPAPVSVEETIAEIVWPEPTEDQALDSFPLQDDDDDLVGSMDQFEAHDTGPMLQLGGGGHSLDLSGGHLRGDGAP